MKSLNSSEVAALIPQYWDVTASSVEDVIFFGQVTIREIIRSWRYTANDLASQIKDADGELKLLKNKGAAGIREIAKQYESPEFPHISVPKDSWSRNPEPLDTASINRKHDATTFNFCGWCKYAGGGLYRYNYYITSSCSIKNATGGAQDEVCRFNSPCFLKEAPDKVFDEIRDGLTRKRERLIEEKQKTDEKIKFLLTLEKRAEKKPAMPNHRPYDWFNVDDLVVCYVGKWKKRIVHDNFATAKVINYDHYDDYVSICYDERFHADEYLEGHGGLYGWSRPEVMHKWEFEYLLGHSDFASLWLKKGTSKRLEGFDAEQFLEAFALEAVRRGREQKRPK